MASSLSEDVVFFLSTLGPALEFEDRNKTVNQIFRDVWDSPKNEVEKYIKDYLLYCEDCAPWWGGAG